LTSKKGLVNLQIGDNDLIGNKFNGYELHLSLRTRGIDSSHLVWNKESKDNSTYVIAGEKADRNAIRAYNEYIQRLYDLDNVHNPLIYDIIYNKLFLDADIIHLHLMHNGLWDLNLLPFMSKLKPIVWSVHDMWIATGSEHAKERRDYYFPPLTGTKNTELNWEFKKEAIKNSNVKFVVASKYMEQAMNEFPLFEEKGVIYIPYILNFSVFYPREKTRTRKELGLDPKEKLVMVRGSGGVRKGLPYIEYVMKKLGKKHKLHFLIVGGNELQIPKGIKATLYSWLRDDELMAKLYSVTDLFLMPSTREYFGMMAIEAMACGTLPIVMEGTSLPEAVNSPFCGIATSQNLQEYTDAVDYYLTHTKEREEREEKGIKYVRGKHDAEKILPTIEKLYRTLIDGHKMGNNYTRIINEMRSTNEIKPLLEPISPKTSKNAYRYLEKDIFFKEAMEPLKIEIAKLTKNNDDLLARNGILLADSKKLEAIYNSKRWRYASKLAEAKNKITRSSHEK
jgi:glycosyltransferase involved in cell wall biosynthesis